MPRPGSWLRLTALFAALAVLLAVVSGAASLGTAHRLLAALALPPLLALVVSALTFHRRLLVPSLSALALFGIAALVTAPGLHLAFAAVAFAAALVLAVATYRGEAAPAGSWRDYVTLTKPRIMSLLLITGLCGMFVAERGVPAASLIVVTMTGLALACGGASALNHVLDRDIDKLMGTRTRARPLAAERMPPSRALEFGLTLSAFSFVLLASFVNVLTATLALVGNLFYVLVYTRLLKRSTPQNIVIGGAAGAVPPLVGWAAATGNLTLPALALFAVVFLWTPPHFWALAIRYREDYAAADVPMLPAVVSLRATSVRILIYTLVLWACTVVFSPVADMGNLYLGAAIVLGGLFTWMSFQLTRNATPQKAMRLFGYSITYITLLFGAMAVDQLLRSGI